MGDSRLDPAKLAAFKARFTCRYGRGLFRRGCDVAASEPLARPWAERVGETWVHSLVYDWDTPADGAFCLRCGRWFCGEHISFGRCPDCNKALDEFARKHGG